jgi:hypothetical protein
MATKNSESLVLLGKQSGWTLIPGDTPLTRLNYFDGKFLRAADLKAEQDYLRNLVQLSNAADGPGVAHGFDLTLGDGGATLNIASGLAIDPTGRVLLLTGSATVSIQQLIEQSRNKDLDSTSGAKAAAGVNMFGDCEVASDAPPTAFQQPADLYLITISFAEGYCGEEDVYGKLCEEACATSTDRPFVVEGLVLRATPLQLGTPLARSNAVSLTQKHRRSLVASAYFNDERQAIASLISGIGIKSDVWCFGAQSAAGAGVPLGVLARAGGTATLFLDVWTARRERIDTSSKRYWQWRMRMRPWDVFLAQILQFQCQLRGVFKNTPVPGVPDPCDNAHKLVAEASEMMAEITRYYEEVSGRLAQLSGNLAGVSPFKGGITSISTLQQKLQTAKEAHLIMPSNRLLINGGIVELPSAGYLPVAPGEAISVNEQVRLMMGEGVDLRFCIVRPDYVAHALEEAQHMERISLIEGLDDPKKIPDVDILVPDGEIIEEKKVAGKGFEAALDLLPGFIYALILELTNPPASFRLLDPKEIKINVPFRGAARSEVLPGGGRAFHVAMQLDDKQLLAESALTGFSLNTDTTVNTAPASTGTAENTATVNLDSNETEKKDASGAVAGGEGAGASEASAAEAGPSEQSEPEESAPKKRLFERLKSAVLRMSRNAATMGAASGQDAASNTPESDVAAGPSFIGATDFSVPQVGLSTKQPLFEAGAWLTMTCDIDPSKLQAGQLLHVNASVVAGIISQLLPDSAYFEGGINAKVLINDVRTMGGKKTVACTLIVTPALTVKFKSVKEPDAGTVQVDAEISWGSLDGGAGKSVEVVVHDPEGKGGVRFTATWGKQPLEVGGRATFMYEQRDDRTLEDVLHEIDVADVKFISNPDVLEPENEKHVRALKALQVLGTALNRPAFVDISTAMIFPPLPPPSAELTVRATRDWVLFHRRRNKTCKLDVPPKPPAPNRRYQVYHLAIKDLGPLDTIPGALRNNRVADLQKLNFQPVTVVEFGANLATLASNPQNVVADWANVHPGNLLVYAAVASQAGVEGGNFLATQRLHHMEDAIASVSHADTQTKVETIPSVPTPLTAPGTDGSIILLTRAATTCHTVYRASRDEALQNSLMDFLLKKEDIPGGLNLVQSLGNVSFKADSAEVADNNSQQSVITKWNAPGESEPLFGVLLFNKSEQATTQDLYFQQTKEIFKALGGTLSSDPERFLVKGVTLPQGCPAISVFTVNSTCLAVYHVGRASEIDLTLNDAVNNDTLGSLINANTIGRFTPVGNVVFDKGTANSINGGLVQAQSSWTNPPITGKKPGKVLLVARKDSSASDKKAFQQQAALIYTTLGGTGSSSFDVRLAALPSSVSCPAMMFIGEEST